MKIFTLSAILAISSVSMLKSQSIERSVIGSAGSFVSAGSVQLSWTAGETVVATATAGSVMLTQGFQQPEIPPSSVQKLNGESKFLVYPNPTKGLIHLEYKSNLEPIDEIELIRVFNNAGQVVFTMNGKQFVGKTIDLNLQNLSEGIYTLAIDGVKHSRETYKITLIQ